MNGYYSKLLLVSVASLLVLASSVSSAPPPPQDEPPDNVAGNWTIYSKDIDKNSSATKFVTIIQKGNVLTGHFKGPNQSGGIQGSINVHHIVFATKTRNVLTFRGTVNGDRITGMYGLHGQHAEFQAVRQN
jgi:hypothetical protein